MSAFCPEGCPDADACVVGYPCQLYPEQREGGVVREVEAHRALACVGGCRTTLADFLLSRIHDDESLARASSTPPIEAMDGWPVNSAALAVRFDPARVLVECEAKRQIVALHNRCDDWSYGDPSTCPELLALATIYATHPDYDEEWKLHA